MAEPRYLFDNAATVETALRFAGLEATFDRATFRFLEATGISDGASCWEVGAGGGSVARWLAERVGPTGSVLATDIDPRFLPPATVGNLRVLRHDLTVDPIPEACYDLIHARLVLNHLPQRGDLLTRLVAALRPGGWLLIEDFCQAFERGSEAVSDADARLRKVRAAMSELLARHTANLSDYATSLPHRLAGLGLIDVGGEGRVVFARGGSPAVQVVEAGLRQIGDELVSSGLVDRAALDEAIVHLTTPASIVALPVMVSAWGRRQPLG